MENILADLSERIRAATSARKPLRIHGGGSKDFYGGEPRGDVLDVTACRGIVSYEPTELVITARAGTPLAEIETALGEKGQMLPFEPPHFGSLIPSPSPGGRRELTASPLPPGEGSGVRGMATLGGCIAAGLSGPRRPYAGAARDFVLGVRLLDGKGEDLRFGGQVMKNVAGYDVSRLVVGSLGTLGLLTEVSLKVLPAPASETTLRFECEEAGAISAVNEWAGKPLPLSATAFRDGELRVRLSGARTAVEAAAKKLGGKTVNPAEAARYWTGIREQDDPFFAGDAPLWRLSVRSTTRPLDLPGTQLIEWGGALRWLRTDADARLIRDAAVRAGGHATLFRARDKSAGVFQPLAPALMRLHRNLKQAMDPAGIFNPGRLYPDL
jgi:glycolate oxidase FAD binding subunit